MGERELPLEYTPPSPFICIGCTVDRHELCSAPAHVFCLCGESNHDFT